MNDLVIANMPIRRDADGRYCLNDMHRAAVAEGENARSKEPSKFLNSPQTIALRRRIEAEQETTQNLGSSSAVSPVATIEGRDGGTFVCIEIAIHYGMWVSSAFELRVIRAYMAMKDSQGDALARFMLAWTRLQQAQMDVSAAAKKMRAFQLESPALKQLVHELWPQLELFDMPDVVRPALPAPKPRAPRRKRLAAGKKPGRK